MTDHIDGPLYLRAHGPHQAGHGLRASQPDGPRAGSVTRWSTKESSTK
jgi:hypothetical protein